MNIKTSSARRMTLAVLTATTLAAGVVGASSASATPIGDVQHGRISYQGLAVGKTIDKTTGVPANDADFQWDLTDGVTKVLITGKFAVIDRSGVPVRLDLHYYKGLDGTGDLVSSPHTVGFTPASDTLVVKTINLVTKGGVGVQSADLCVASDADRDGKYTDESCVNTSL
jgi:hypothetical protein